MARRAPEFALHKTVAHYLDVALPSDAAWWHTPNGGKRSKVEAAKLKAVGTKAGVADCLIVYRGKIYAIELKAVDGSVSPAQVAWLIDFRVAGGEYIVARSFDAVHRALTAWGIPLRAQPFGLGTVRATSAGSRRAA